MMSEHNDPEWYRQGNKRRMIIMVNSITGNDNKLKPFFLYIYCC